MAVRLRVIVDERERSSGIPSLLKGFGLQVEHRMLDGGDYVVSPECAIERKEGQDLLKSLYSGRLFDQAYHLGESYNQPVLIVDGEVSSLTRGMARPRAFWGALATLTFEYSLNVFFTLDACQTADLIYISKKRRRFIRPKGTPYSKEAQNTSSGENAIDDGFQPPRDWPETRPTHA